MNFTFNTPPRRQELQHGVVIAIVTNNQDPDELGRIKVKFPWLSDSEESGWIRIISPYAGKERGIVFFPEVDDEVAVAFEFGDINSPFILGSLYNGVDIPPELNSDGDNNIKMIKTRSGHTIKFDDTEDAEKIEIIDAGESNMLTIDTAENKIIIESAGDIELKAPDGKVGITAKEIELVADETILMEAGSTFDINAPSDTLSLNASEAQINSDSSLDVSSGGDTNIDAGGNANVTGATINLN